MINDKKITISIGQSRTSKSWLAQELYYSELLNRLSTPVRTSESFAEYCALNKAGQDALKDVGGFVGGRLRGGARKSTSVIDRQLIALDADNIPAGGTKDVLLALSGCGAAYAVYSTRRHQPAAPRLRILLPLDRPAAPEEYEPIARKLAEIIGMSYFDPTTFEASRLMYWPSCSMDSEYIYIYEDKPWASADGILALYGDWRDCALWPQVPGADK